LRRYAPDAVSPLQEVDAPASRVIDRSTFGMLKISLGIGSRYDQATEIDLNGAMAKPTMAHS